jgi:hypothetical protein
LFDEDSGLGMDFDNFQDSPTLLQNSNLNSKRKRQEASEKRITRKYYFAKISKKI